MEQKATTVGIVISVLYAAIITAISLAPVSATTTKDILLFSVFTSPSVGARSVSAIFSYIEYAPTVNPLRSYTRSC